MKRRIIPIALVLALLLAFAPMAAADEIVADMANFDAWREARVEEYGAYEPGVTFTDIGDDRDPIPWYNADIRSAFEYGVVEGVGNARFAPSSNLSGFQVLTIAARIHSIYKYGSVVAEGAIGSYEGDWKAQAVEYSVAEGLATSEFADQITAKSAATRGETALVWANILAPEDLPVINAGFMAADVPEDSPYFEAVKIFYEAGITQGSGAEFNFGPDRNLTRAESAAMFMRLVDPDERLERLVPADSLGGDYFIDLTPAGMPMVLFLEIKDGGAFTLYNSAGLVRNTGVAVAGAADSFKFVYDNRTETATFTVADEGELVFSSALPFGPAMNLTFEEDFVTAVLILADGSNIPGVDPEEAAAAVLGTYNIDLADYGMPMPMVFSIIITEDNEFAIERDGVVRNAGKWELRMFGYVLIYDTPENHAGARANFRLEDGALVFEGFVPLGGAGANPPEDEYVIAQPVTEE